MKRKEQFTRIQQKEKQNKKTKLFSNGNNKMNIEENPRKTANTKT